MGKYIDAHPDIWLKYLDEGGSLDIELMAADIGGVEAVRAMLTRGQFGKSVISQVREWLMANDQREAGEIARRQAEAAEMQARAATKALKISRISVALSVVALLIAFGGFVAQILDLLPYASRQSEQVLTPSK